MSGLSVWLPANAPSWLLALIVVSFLVESALLALVRLARHTMPQDSGDRAAWWSEMREFRAERRRERQRATLTPGTHRTDRPSMLTPNG